MNFPLYHRRITVQTQIGDLSLGSDAPIRIQSMTTVDTMDTLGSVEEAIRMVESGCELIRITAPSIKEAQNLEEIKKELRKRRITVPLVADIHFTPNAAELAARIVEKVRINPGNYADKKRFEIIEYTDQAYQAELERIRERFIPLIKICKEYGTAMRIGTNHGSLSDRILSRYGDTPEGMTESALEFLKFCEDEQYYNVVLSMKSSNPIVMVQAYRLLVKRIEEERLKPYPLHLGVTEAGEGEDGRIKSAMGIGTLLEEGLGDTVRVSLTENPEYEAPVAKKLIARYPIYAQALASPNVIIDYHRRLSNEISNFGKGQLPRVIGVCRVDKLSYMSDFKPFGHHYMPLLDKWVMDDTGVDCLYFPESAPDFMLPNGVIGIVDLDKWKVLSDQRQYRPMVKVGQIHDVEEGQLAFCWLTIEDFQQDVLDALRANTILILHAQQPNAYTEFRNMLYEIRKAGLKNPIVFSKKYKDLDLETIQLQAAIDIGGQFVDGFGDGVMIEIEKSEKDANSLAFGILQAARTRMSKTEYISCPSCGRTLFDLQETTAMIRKQTDHLKGLKIGIMGCIVNGPGEMADADYGYVGMGKDKIALYRGQEVVKRSVNAASAVDELIQIIKSDGKWIEPKPKN